MERALDQIARVARDVEAARLAEKADQQFQSLGDVLGEVVQDHLSSAKRLSRVPNMPSRTP